MPRFSLDLLRPNAYVLRDNLSRANADLVSVDFARRDVKNVSRQIRYLLKPLAPYEIWAPHREEFTSWLLAPNSIRMFQLNWRKPLLLSSLPRRLYSKTFDGGSSMSVQSETVMDGS